MKLGREWCVLLFAFTAEDLASSSIGGIRTCFHYGLCVLLEWMRRACRRYRHALKSDLLLRPQAAVGSIEASAAAAASFSSKALKVASASLAPSAMA